MGEITHGNFFMVHCFFPKFVKVLMISMVYIIDKSRINMSEILNDTKYILQSIIRDIERMERHSELNNGLVHYSETIYQTQRISHKLTKANNNMLTMRKEAKLERKNYESNF